MNKIIDYLTYLLVGAFIGFAITEPLGSVCHITTAAIGLGFGCVFDISSIIGHVFAVKGLKWHPRAALLGLLRWKSPEIGDIVQQATQNTDTENSENTTDKNNPTP